MRKQSMGFKAGSFCCQDQRSAPGRLPEKNPVPSLAFIADDK